jgi:hypothetical protein
LENGKKGHMKPFKRYDLLNGFAGLELFFYGDFTVKGMGKTGIVQILSHLDYSFFQILSHLDYSFFQILSHLDKYFPTLTNTFPP